MAAMANEMVDNMEVMLSTICLLYTSAVRRDILLRVPVRQQRYQEEAVVLPSHPQDSVMSAILMYMEETA